MLFRPCGFICFLFIYLFVVVSTCLFFFSFYFLVHCVTIFVFSINCSYFLFSSLSVLNMSWTCSQSLPGLITSEVDMKNIQTKLRVSSDCPQFIDYWNSLIMDSFIGRDTAELGNWTVKNCWNICLLCNSCCIVLLAARYLFDTCEPSTLWCWKKISFLECGFIAVMFFKHENDLMLKLQPEGAAIGNYVIQYALALVCWPFSVYICYSQCHDSAFNFLA